MRICFMIPFSQIMWWDSSGREAKSMETLESPMPLWFSFVVKPASMSRSSGRGGGSVEFSM